MINPHNRIDTIVQQIEVYKRALDEAEKAFPSVLPISREMFVGKDRADAIRQAKPYVAAKYKAYNEWGQDKQMPEGDNDLGMAYEELQDGRFIFGSVDEVAEQIITLAKTTGINQLGCPVQWIGMPQSHVIEQMYLLGEEVLPRVRQGL
jgi:alkanesulfonate monooxygenase SsuD/methylene tetrahydromethanopterin reductase-like flavin-dependent oxidoreductase (luciferase family)